MPALPGSVEAERSGYDPCGWRVASRAHRPGGPGVNRGMALPFTEHPAGPVTVLGQQEPRLCVTVPGPLALLLPSLALGPVFSRGGSVLVPPPTRGGAFLSLPGRLVLEASPPQELGAGGGVLLLTLKLRLSQGCAGSRRGKVIRTLVLARG